MIERVAKSSILWATPTLLIEHKNSEDLNRSLARIIVEEEREILKKGKPTEVAGVTEGLTAHWLEFNVLNWDYPEIAEFRRLVLNGVREYFKLIGDPHDPGFRIKGISCWANILRYGQGLDIHHHDPAYVSAHYQVQSGAGQAENDSNKTFQQIGGQTVYLRPGFLDRSQGGESAGFVSPWDWDWRISSVPIEGNLFFFPSYVRHEVRPYLGNTERISIAMDFYIEKQKPAIYFAPPRWHVPA